MPFISTGMRSASASASSAVSACPHHTLVPAMITGRCASASRSHGRVQRVPVRADRGRRARPAHRVRRRRAPRRTRDPSGSRRTPRRTAAPTAARSASSISAADRVRRLRGGGEPGQRRDERHMVDLLQRPLPPAQRGRPPAEHHQRRLVLLCGGHRAHPVGDAGTRGQRGDAGHPGHLRPAFGGERGGLLVAGVDQPDALGAAAVVDGEQVPAGQREDRVDAAGPQPAGDQVSGVDRATDGASMLMARSIISGAWPTPQTRRC